VFKLFFNVGLLVYLSGIWFACGYGVVRVLLPRCSRFQAGLLAPLIGMCLLGLAGLLELTIVLTPLRPIWNTCLLCLVSVVLVLLARRKAISRAGISPNRMAMLLAVPFAALLAHAALYRHDGFHLLVASQDQLQYCDHARHMLEVMHTDSPLDVPVPRQDHFVTDVNTRVTPYMKGYRRGAEVILATTASLTGQTAEAAFPLTVGASLLALGLSLAFLGWYCLRLPVLGCLALQTVFLVSSHLLLLHYQGSLAHLLAIPLFLMVLGLAPRALRGRSPGRIALLALLGGSALSFYSEPAIVAVVGPLGLLFAWRLWVEPRKWPVVRRILALVALIVLVSPLGVYSLACNTFGNLAVVRSQLATPPVNPGPADSLFSSNLFGSSFWAQLITCLGFSSFYDQTAYNATISVFTALHPWSGWVAFASLAILGAIGLLLCRRATTWLYACTLLVWAVSCFLFAHTQDYLRFFRAAQYALPYVFVGLVVFSFSNRQRLSSLASWFSAPFVWTTRIVLVIFLLANGSTAVRTFCYTVSHDVYTDGIVLRFHDMRAEWCVLRGELRASGESPVLISGYADTIHPHILGLGIRPAPHFLGDSIVRFWAIMPPAVGPLDHAVPRSSLNTRCSAERYHAEIRRQNRHWNEVVPEFLERSVQAVVPPGHDYPEEWEPWRDVFPPRVRKGLPYCDIVYKTEHALFLSSTGKLERDERGPFRQLGSEGIISFQQAAPPYARLRLRHDGDVDDVELVSGEARYTGRFLSPCGQVEIAALVDTTVPICVRKTGDQEVKLRSIRVSPLEGATGKMPAPQ
jgi:hypothetical protein